MNTNCLKGKRCPSCRSDGPFKVVGQSWMLLTDDGSEAVGDTTFWDSSLAVCVECDYQGRWKSFDRVKSWQRQRRTK